MAMQSPKLMILKSFENFYSVLKDKFIQNNNIVDTCTSTSSTLPLSANQGRVLNNKIESLYPVGYIFIWCNNKSDGTVLNNAPDLSTAEKMAEHFGGTWQKINGRFLFGEYTASNNTTYSSGKTGGNYNYTLSAENLPQHTHSIPSLKGTAASNGKHKHTITTIYKTDARIDGNHARVAADGPNTTTEACICSEAGAHTHSVTTTASTTGIGNGKSKAYNIMPPYFCVYMWQRIA